MGSVNGGSYCSRELDSQASISPYIGTRQSQLRCGSIPEGRGGSGDASLDASYRVAVDIVQASI